MYAKYRGQVAFLMVYTREAHPSVNGKRQAPFMSGPNQADTRSLPERSLIACKVAAHYHIAFQTVVDNMANSTQVAYDTDPDRLFVVDNRGALAYVGGIGPGGFHPDQIPPILDRLLKRPSPHSDSRK